MTDQVKAIKVRFREAQNSAEVLDFNLYLSPFDVWTAKITDSDADDGGAKLITKTTPVLFPRFPRQVLLSGTSYMQAQVTLPVTLVTRASAVPVKVT